MKSFFIWLLFLVLGMWSIVGGIFASMYVNNLQVSRHALEELHELRQEYIELQKRYEEKHEDWLRLNTELWEERQRQPIANRSNYQRNSELRSFKSFMCYTAITNRNSIQWQLQQNAWTDELGFRRYGNDYMVALGTYYASSAGQRFEIELSGGRTFTAITGDIKSNNHTDSNNRFTAHNGCEVEFVIDVSKLCQTIRRMGDASHGGFWGNIVRIDRL